MSAAQKVCVEDKTNKQTENNKIPKPTALNFDFNLRQTWLLGFRLEILMSAILLNAYMCVCVDSILKRCLCMGVQVFILKFRLYYLLDKYTQTENTIDINEVRTLE